MHSCHRTILLKKVYFSTSNNLRKFRKFLSVAGASSYFFQMFDYPKIGKNVNVGSDTHISDAKMNPFTTFGPDIFAYLKQIGGV